MENNIKEYNMRLMKHQLSHKTYPCVNSQPVDQQIQNEIKDEPNLDIKSEFGDAFFKEEDTDTIDCEYTDIEILDTDLLEESEESNAYVIICSSRNGSDSESCKKELPSDEDIDDINEYSSEDDTQSEMEFRLKCNMKVIKLSVEEQIRDVQARKFKLFYKVAPFKCAMCFRGFDLEGEFTSHCNISHNEERKYQCELCFYRFKKESNFSKHMTSHSRKYVCRKCYFVCRTKAVAYQHHRAHALERLCCKYCGEMFNKFSLYLAHVRYLHPAKMKNCEVCAESFLTKNKLLLHMRTHEVKKASDEAQTPFQSFHKTETFLSQGIISNEKRCNMCYKTFKTVTEYYEHNKNVHSTKPVNPTIDIANGTKPPATNTVKHKKSSNSVLNIMCEVCGKLMKIQVIHSSEVVLLIISSVDPTSPTSDPRVCKLTEEPSPVIVIHFDKFPDNNCKKRHQSTVKYHEKIHSGMRPYQCKQCPKTFPTSLQLDYHQYSHSDERPYACTMCDKAFKLPSALQRHHKVHTGEKSYECPLCGKMFTQSFNVKFHVKTVHLKIPPPPRKMPRKLRYSSSTHVASFR